MLSKEQTGAIAPGKRVMLIIFAALILGVSAFAAFVCVLRIGDEGGLFNLDFGFFAIMGVGFAALVLLPSLIVPLIMKKQAVTNVANEFSGKMHDSRAAIKLLGGLQTSMIVRLSLLDGAAFFNILAFFLDGSVYNLLATGVLLVLMFLSLPLPGRIDNKISDMLDEAKLKG